MARMTFAEWMKRVDEAVWRKAGCSVRDLGDCCYRDWYDDNVRPATAARRAVEYNGFAD
uniref:Uncharacterized protein n=1 Tax=viral metagenome TaxID=1070528 RepID=A0A6M3J0D7_9ZZZZ